MKQIFDFNSLLIGSFSFVVCCCFFSKSTYEKLFREYHIIMSNTSKLDEDRRSVCKAAVVAIDKRAKGILS